MPMKKQERKDMFAEIISLLLTGKNKQAYTELACMCGKDTGLFFMADYDEYMEALKSKKTLSFQFQSEDQKNDFSAWLQDGGGEDSLANYCEIRDQPYFSINKKPNSNTVQVVQQD